MTVHLTEAQNALLLSMIEHYRGLSWVTAQTRADLNAIADALQSPDGVKPDTLCATCKHLQKTASGFKFCEHRSSEKYDCVCIDKGFKRCQAYERKENQQ